MKIHSKEKAQKRLAIITTHPIQYNAPWFQLLTKRGIIKIKVFYTWSQVEHIKKYDPGFGKIVEWDIPLLKEYDYSFIQNVSKNPGSKSFSGIVNPTLIEEIKEWAPDAILVFGWKYKSHLNALRHYKNKIPVLFRGDSTTLDDKKGLLNWLRYQILKLVYSKIDVALYTGSENKKYFIRSGLAEKQLVLAPHAIDNLRFNKNLDTISFREQMHISNTALIFLFSGKLESKKNPLLLAEAFMDTSLSNAHLVFVGNGKLENKLKDTYRRPNIHFIDFQNQQMMPAIYQMADVYVLPSQGKGESWGLAVNEAMAAGKPVLVSDKCGCASDLVEQGRTGYIFKSNDLMDLKNKIHEMASDKNRLNDMGEIAREKIQQWSFDSIVNAVEDIVINFQIEQRKKHP